MQATIDGPRTHPLAAADRVTTIESSPATWIHDDSDGRPCEQCGAYVPLAEGDYVVATLVTDRGKYREKTLVRVCSEACYRDWAGEARADGWA